MPYDAYEIKKLLREHSARVLRGDATNSTSAILPANTIKPNVDIVQEMKNHGLSMIEECLQTPTPQTFTLQFEVSHTYPACSPTSIGAIKTLCTKKKDGSSSFRFALHIKDASSEMDVLCLGKVAEKLLGITVREVISGGTAEKCQRALNFLEEIMLPGSICEGTVRSIVGKDGKLYFYLMSMLCIPAESL